MGALDPGEIFHVVEAVVSPSEQVRRVARRRICAGEADRWIAGLVGIRSDASDSVLRREVYSLVLALLSARYTKERDARFAGEIGGEDMCLSDGEALGASGQEVAEPGYKAFI